MARRPAKALEDEDEPPTPVDPDPPFGSIVRGARLEPIRFVERELTRPDGTKLRVKVPVYPPFRLEDRSAPPPGPDARKRPPDRRKAS